ncbi:uncharacterized protein G2W53_015458 [Senna tora]|uniref:Uncharacterized protein n=1 Tax=Senna tora TaxID=362788 RepID=A0A834WVM1_9FABA|nr:uncharacterized protein G2W53_015458 [Senna tora]
MGGNSYCANSGAIAPLWAMGWHYSTILRRFSAQNY